MITTLKNNYLTLFASAVFFIAFAGIGIRNLFGWTAYGVIVGLVVIASAVFYFKQPERPKIKEIKLPFFLVSFVAFCLLTVIWSNYPLETLLASVIQIATGLTGLMLLSLLKWEKLIRSLHTSLQVILAGSILFEVYVALFIRQPFLPPSLKIQPGEDIPGMYYWSGANIFTGGPIAGLAGNRNLLGFVALLAIIIAATLLSSYSIKKWNAAITIILGIAVHFLTMSATITLGLAGVGGLYALIMLMRAIRKEWRKPAYYALGVVSLLGMATFITYSATIFSLVGREADLTNRAGIWRKVIALAQERPEGWGWISHWAPWVEPYKNLVVIDGNVQLHAHNAFFDILLQVGVAGAIIALAVAIIAAKQSWHLAVTSDPEIVSSRKSLLNTLPLLLLAALLIQSITESRLLIEGNWMLFVIVCAYANIRVSTWKKETQAKELEKISN